MPGFFAALAGSFSSGKQALAGQFVPALVALICISASIEVRVFYLALVLIGGSSDTSRLRVVSSEFPQKKKTELDVFTNTAFFGKVY